MIGLGKNISVSQSHAGLVPPTGVKNENWNNALEEKKQCTKHKNGLKDNKLKNTKKLNASWSFAPTWDSFEVKHTSFSVPGV